MYAFIDRPVSNLCNGGRFLLWAMRGWVHACEHGRCPPRVLHRGFAAVDVQGALVSLVYNRGTRMADSPGTDDRREMRAIRDLVAEGLVVGIPEQLRSMQRLWIGKGLDGLIRRREAEAQLVDSAIAAGLRALGRPDGHEPAVAGPRAAPTRSRRWTEASFAPAFGASRKAIVLDHLSPTRPELAGQPAYMAPDMSFDSYTWDKGRWRLERDIDLRGPGGRPYKAPPKDTP